MLNFHYFKYQKIVNVTNLGIRNIIRSHIKLTMIHETIIMLKGYLHLSLGGSKKQKFALKG